MGTKLMHITLSVIIKLKQLPEPLNPPQIPLASQNVYRKGPEKDRYWPNSTTLLHPTLSAKLLSAQSSDRPRDRWLNIPRSVPRSKVWGQLTRRNGFGLSSRLGRKQMSMRLLEGNFLHHSLESFPTSLRYRYMFALLC